jgi:1-acyl-sn-glycerol-3-phosphate acyltransferase
MLGELSGRIRRAFEGRLDDELVERIEALRAELGGRATDDFGFDPDSLKIVAPLVEWFYRNYFRVEPHGLENLPPGRVLLVSNHSGQVPIDGMMIASALLFDAHPPRAARSMVERWVPTLPFVSTFFARVGQVLGAPENCRVLLGQEHAILVFPEGVRGINKTYDQAYRLQAFGNGFMRLALETRTPIVPVGVVGAEEQYPALTNLRPVAKALGLPALPITPLFPLAGPLGLLPLPVKYRIYFGEPMQFEGEPDDEDAIIGARVARVRDAVDALLRRGLAEREHIFW